MYCLQDKNSEGKSNKGHTMRFLGKIYKVIFSRAFITAMLIILQVIWFLLIYSYFFVGYEYVRTAVSALALLYTIYVINSPRTQREYQTEWIIVILLFPFFGVPFYTICGDQWQGRKYAKRVEDAKAKYSSFHNQDMNLLDEIYKQDSRIHSTCTYMMKSMGYPVYKNTKVTYLSSGEEQYEGLIEAMKNAKHYIFMEYFMIERTGVWNSMLEVIRQKAEEGVEIRILYDDLGCISWLPKRYDKFLNKLHKNIHCKKFNRVKPLFTMLTNNRDHRKMSIIDGYIAFTGGINLADRYINVNSPFGHWKDAGLRIEGEAVQNFTLMYLEMWESMKIGRSSRKIETPEEMKKINSYLPHFFHETDFTNDGYVQPFGDEPFDNVPLSENAYLELINQAEKYLYVFTPYLIPSQSMTDAMCLAAERGVDVRIVTPHIPDKRIVFRITRSNYKKFMEHGVKIYEYTPGFIHSKCMLCDNDKAIVGTVNLDYRSLFLHFEDAVLLYKCEAVNELRKDMIRTFKESRLQTEEDTKRNIFGRLLDAILVFFEPIV